MRNLKKILALALALIMSLSLVTTAGAFSDDGDINANYQDAIDVLSGLDVFKGYSDGSFQPKGSITRAEVAAIIYRIDTGDVTDTQASIYSTWGKFKDVADGAWYAGYVNYCANAEYIKGRGNGVFDPQATVTGYEALAMILRAVGYDKNGEFTGSNWQVRTASIGRERGILKNVTEGLLGQAASRELVAEILFRSIIIPKVEFNANTLGYKLKGDKETIGYESFKLEKITGIVTGNEFADLENSKTMNEGKTRMIVDGSKYIVDYSTGVDDLGEERSMYITNANTTSAKFLVLEDSDKNVTFETLDKKGIGSDGDFKSVTGLQRGASTQQFLNFDEVQEWKSDYKISYILTSEKAFGTDLDAAKAWVKEKNLTSNFTFDGEGRLKGDTSKGGWYLDTDGYVKYGVEFRIGDAITGIHRANIEEIFNVADKFHDVPLDMLRGEVYVGTTSLKDISDELSLKQFVEQYINNTEGKISDNENGNWLKVIDNDNDGQADYVFKIVYTMAQVVRAKDGKYGLDTEDRTLCGKDAVNEITRDDAVSDDTLGLGDVVYYTFIDDVIRAYKAETASVKVDTVNRKDLKITTSDGTEYTESGVCGTHVLSKEYNCGVVNMNGSATYDIFLDRGGYLALFTDSNAGDFKLIVDGWYNSTKNGVEYAARVYNDETGRQDVVDLTRGGSMFISNNVIGTNGKDAVQNNDWNALKWLGGVSVVANPDDNRQGALSGQGAMLNGEGGVGREVKTTVATLTGDGVILPVDYASNSNTGRIVRMVATDKNAIPTSAASYSATLFATGSSLSSTDTAYDTREGGTVEVRALSNTVYYFVYPRANAESGFVVERYVGYSSVPSVNDRYVEDVYAVATQQERVSTLGDSKYYTANVVVVELTHEYKGSGEEVFIYNMPLATGNVQIENVDLIHADGTKEENVKVDFRASNIRDYRVAMPANAEIPNWNPGLYYLYPTNAEGVYTVEKMSPAAIAELNYAVGWVGTAGGTLSNNYVSVVTFDNNGVAYNETEPANASSSNIYTLSYNNKGLADLGVYGGSEGWIQKYLGEQHSDKIMAADRYTGSFPYDHTPYQGHDSWWNQNRVLVHYAGNGSIQYAISFANRDGDSPNLARYVWEASRPSNDAWRSENNSRADAIDFAEFMLKWYGKGEYNITTTPNGILAAMRDALANNANRKVNDSDIDALIARINAIIGTPDTETTVEVVDTNDTAVTTNPETVTAVNGYAQFTITLEEGQTVESVAGTDCAANLGEDGMTVTVTEAVEGAKVVVTFAEEPVVNDTDVTVVFVDKDGEPVEALTEDDNAEITYNEDEDGNVVSATIELVGMDGYEVVGVENADENEDGTYTAVAGAEVIVTVKAKTVSTADKVVVTLQYYYNGEDTGRDADVVLPEKALTDGSVVLSLADDITPTDLAGAFYVRSVTGGGVTCTANADKSAWTVSGITGDGENATANVTLIVDFDTKAIVNPGPVEGGMIGWEDEGTSARARSGEVTRRALFTITKGNVPAGIIWCLPNGVFTVDIESAENAGTYAGDARFDLWKIPVTAASADAFAEASIRVKTQAAGTSEDPTDEILPYRAVLKSDSKTEYQLYGYGQIYDQLTAEQIKTAIAAAEKVDKSAVEVDTGYGVAYVTKNGGEKYRFYFPVTGDGSMVHTIQLYKVSYNGKLLDYATDASKVSGFCGGGKGLVVPDKSTNRATNKKAVAKGKITTATSLTDDVNYIDIVSMEFTVASGANSGVNNYSLDGGTPVSPSMGDTLLTAYVTAGEELEIELGNLTDGETYTVWFENKTTANKMTLDTVKSFVAKEIGTGISAHYEYTMTVPEFPAELGSDMKVTFEAPVQHYSVYLNGSPVEGAQNVTEFEEDGKTATVISLGTELRKLLASTKGTNTAPVKYWSSTEPTFKEGYFGKTKISDIKSMADDDGNIWLYDYVTLSGSKVNDVKKVTFNGVTNDVSTDWSVNTSYYVVKGAVLTLEASDDDHVITVKEGDDDAKVLKASTYTTGDRDVVVGELELVKTLSVRMTVADGAAVTVADSRHTTGAKVTRVAKDENGHPDVEKISAIGKYIVTVSGIKPATGYSLDDMDSISLVALGASLIGDETKVAQYSNPDITKEADGTYTVVIYLNVKTLS